MMSKGRLFLLVPLAFVVVLLGCGKKSTTPASVSGIVKYKGAPVTGGSIQVYVKDAGAYPVSLNADGTYSATKLPAGDVTFTVETESVNSSRPVETYGGKKGMTSPAPGSATTAAKEVYVKIPAKYGDPKTSGLTMTLQAGKQSKDWELSD